MLSRLCSLRPIRRMVSVIPNMMHNQCRFNFCSDAINQENSQQVKYEKGVINHNYQRTYETYSSPFFHFWKKSFKHIEFELVPKEQMNQIQNADICLGGNAEYEVVVKDNVNSYISRELQATIDVNNSKRVFITHRVRGEYASTYGLGAIVYFDSDGQQISETICPKPIFELDFRNGFPDKHTLFFCGNSLIFVWTHRDCRTLRLSGAMFDEDRDDPVKFAFELNTDHQIYILSPEIDILLNKWLRIHKEHAQTVICFDIQSFRLIKDDKKVLYDQIIIDLNKNDDIDTKCIKCIKSLTDDIPSYEKTNRDGYPLKCIKCGNDTTSGSLKTNIETHSFTSIGLGRGVCDKCFIRYSLSGQRWECWKIINTKHGDHSHQTRCDGKVEAPDYCCANEKDHAVEVEFTGHASLTSPNSQPHFFFAAVEKQ